MATLLSFAALGLILGVKAQLQAGSLAVALATGAGSVGFAQDIFTLDNLVASVMGDGTTTAGNVAVPVTL